MKRYINALFLTSIIMSYSVATETNINIPNDGTEETYISGKTFTNKKVVYEIKDDLAFFEGDIVLGTVDQAEAWRELNENSQIGNGESSVIITGDRYRWENGILPYQIASNVNANTKTLIARAIAHWEAKTSVRFVKRTSSNANKYPDYVEVVSDDNACWSYAGKTGNKQKLNVIQQCGFGATVHEFGHALGLWHEQSREDRNKFIRVNYANIIENMKSNFNQHISNGDDVGAYDYSSLMHYGKRAFSKNGKDTITPLKSGVTIGQRNGLSSGDIASIQKMYGSNTLSIEIIPFNSNKSGSWSSSEMSVHRSERYARYHKFTLEKSEQVTIDLTSSTDAYLFLLSGSTKTGAVLAQNDDGGSGYNSRIIKTLSAGTYVIESTTYSSAKIGSFIVRVNKSKTETKPNAPTSFRASNITSTSAKLTWRDNSNNETKFTLYKNGTFFKNISANTESYTLTGLSENTSYTYMIKAYNGAGYSVASSYSFRTLDSIGSITLNSSKTGTWSSNEMSVHRSGKYARYHKFTLTKSEKVTIDLTSSTDAYLFLLSGSSKTGSIIASNDDGGTGYNSRITKTLSAGTYVIESTTYSSAKTGSFSVSISVAKETFSEPTILSPSYSSVVRRGNYVTIRWRNNGGDNKNKVQIKIGNTLYVNTQIYNKRSYTYRIPNQTGDMHIWISGYKDGKSANYKYHKLRIQ